MNAHYASKVLEEMSSDNAVDILNELSKPKVASLLTLMNREDANEIKHLLHYEEDTYWRYHDDGIYLFRCQYSG